ncbi:MAG TPA: YciI family protein [Acidimicrobiales bacterium]|nr:YciI family protein [Acidimicrobiales bacterium]
MTGDGRPVEEDTTMQYLALLGGDESALPPKGTPAFEALMPGYVRFGEVAGAASLGGAALEPAGTATTIRPGDGGPLVTDGPFAETAEAIGGYYVLEAETLDDAIDLARQIPVATLGWVALRPVVLEALASEAAGARVPPASGARYLAMLYGKESAGDVPGTPEWEAGAAEHGRFVEAAGDAVLSGVAVHPVDTTTTVRVRDGEVLVTDGPYAEAAEVAGGVYMLWAPTREAAVSLAAQIPVNPGGAVELRPVMELG